jgi:hypothetical protein
MKTTVLIPIAALALAAGPAAGELAGSAGELAATPQTLTAWHGCWAPVGADAPVGSVVCVLPGESPSAARIVTLEAGEIVGETSLSVDGVARAVEDGGCTGTETASWSRDGRRVFTRTELDCGGMPRVSTGVIAMVAENEWVDVQTVNVGGQHGSRTLRYRSVRPENTPEALRAQLPQDRRLVLESARLQASAALDFDAVVEAAGLIAAPAVEALLAAGRTGFDLDARRLVQLERAGVPGSVLDMMIALSYPQTFAVEERPQPTVPTEPAYWRGGSAMLDECRDPFYARGLSRLECDMLMRRQYGRYGYGFGSPYGYRFGYSPWGYDPYGWNYGNTPIVVIVRPDEERRQAGEVVKGQGYTRGSAPASGRSARSRDDSGAGARPATTTTSRPAATTGSGSSGTSTGRTAIPRNGGGGGGGGEERESGGKR